MELRIITILLCSLFIIKAAGWQKLPLPSARWTAVAVSRDSKVQYAVSNSDGVFFSNRSDNVWEEKKQLPQIDFEAVACSENGSVVLLAGYLQGLFLSTDSGNTFNVAQSVPAANTWYTLAMSSDGKTMFAGTFNESLYRSVDYGNSFSERPYEDYRKGYFSVACDASGQYVIVGLRVTAPIIFSNDSGLTWYSTETINNGIYYSFTGVAMSQDGSVMVAVAAFVGIFVSRDYGQTWTFTRQFTGLLYAACDAFCQNIIVAPFNSFLLQSFNQGQSWQSIRSLGRQDWFGVAADDTGTTALAAAYDSLVYVGELLPPPTASPTIAPTPRPTISFSPSRSPTVASAESNSSGQESADTLFVQTITVVVICVLLVASCLFIMFMRTCGYYTDWSCRNCLRLCFRNPYLVLAGQGGQMDQAGIEGDAVLANVELVQTADTVQIVGDLEGNLGVVPVASSVKPKTISDSTTASPQQVQVAVASAVLVPQPATFAIRPTNI